MCQALEREGVLRLLRQPDNTWQVAGSRLEARARPPPPWPRQPPLRSPPRQNGGAQEERWVMS